jgi:hypothetical protein
MRVDTHQKASDLPSWATAVNLLKRIEMIMKPKTLFLSKSSGAEPFVTYYDASRRLRRWSFSGVFNRLRPVALAPALAPPT